VLHQAANAI
jgi:hypothetical protein